MSDEKENEAELERRLSLPLDQWQPVGEASSATARARAHLDALRELQKPIPAPNHKMPEEK